MDSSVLFLLQMTETSSSVQTQLSGLGCSPSLSASLFNLHFFPWMALLQARLSHAVTREPQTFTGLIAYSFSKSRRNKFLFSAKIIELSLTVSGSPGLGQMINPYPIVVGRVNECDTQIGQALVSRTHLHVDLLSPTGNTGTKTWGGVAFLSPEDGKMDPG